MTYLQILTILAMHTTFDWLLQTRWMAENKSKNWNALSVHVLVYLAGLAIAGLILPFASIVCALIWVQSNTILHFLTDAITSRYNAKHYPNKQFWDCVGIDQLIHYATLFGTYFLLK
jgi:hypothetical protein